MRDIRRITLCAHGTLTVTDCMAVAGDRLRATERLPQAECFDLSPFSLALALGLKRATLTLTPPTYQFPPWPLFAHFLPLSNHTPQDRALLTSLRILTSHLHTDRTLTPN